MLPSGNLTRRFSPGLVVSVRCSANSVGFGDVGLGLAFNPSLSAGSVS